MTTRLDLLITFDTTGSMYPCLAQVRREVASVVKRMFAHVEDLRVAVIAHGDYCDAGSTYVTKTLDFSSDPSTICRFISNVERTGGGDMPECYELVLHESRSLAWGAGREKILVVLGDDVPHRPDEKQNTKHLDWRNELRLLGEAGVKVYGVHAMSGVRKHSRSFYTEMASITGGLYLSLDQFEYITDLLLGVTAQQAGGDNLQNFEQQLKSSGRMNRSKQQIFDTLSGRTSSSWISAVSESTDLLPVPSGRFQVIPVGTFDIAIKDCVIANGATFNVGRGFYEWTKTEKIQDHKEIILQDRDTGDFFSGDAARKLARLPIGETINSRPPNLSKYRAYVQSTSNNRKLTANTTFLYEVDDT